MNFTQVVWYLRQGDRASVQEGVQQADGRPNASESRAGAVHVNCKLAADALLSSCASFWREGHVRKEGRGGRRHRVAECQQPSLDGGGRGRSDGASDGSARAPRGATSITASVVRAAARTGPRSASELREHHGEVSSMRYRTCAPSSADEGGQSAAAISLSFSEATVRPLHGTVTRAGAMPG